MEIKSEFKVQKIYEKTDYTCLVKNQIIPGNLTILKFVGKHERGKTDINVTRIWFISCHLTKVPQNLTKIFPNLQSLRISQSELTTLSKDELAEYKNFKDISFGGNKLESLPDDLFEGFTNLEMIHFYSNRLKMIEGNILNGLDRLIHVDFSDNPNYDLSYSKIDPSYSNATLAELKQKISDRHLKLLFGRRDAYEVYGDEIDELKYEKKNIAADLEAANTKILKLEKVIEQLSIRMNKSATSDLQNFIQQDKSFKDFHIQINEKEFSVHKLLLVARSPVLAEMLSNNPGAVNLKLVDISVGIFEKIHKFLYTDELPVDETDFLHLFVAAGRLQIEELKNHAAGKLLNQIDAENAFEILKLSNKYQHDELRQKAFDEIKKKYPNIDFKDELAVDVDKLKEVLDFLRKKEEYERKLDEDLAKLLKI